MLNEKNIVFWDRLISNRVFTVIIGIFVISMASVVYVRAGKDLKVGLFGVEQILQKKSPYDNPTDPGRPIYRYAPGLALLQFPFLLKSKPTAPFEFTDILPSVFAWYFICLLSLFLSGWLLLKLIPSFSKETSIRNLKISILMTLPLIGYELSNGQNKLIALFFMILSLYLFEKKRLFLSAFSFCLALTVYVALLPFLFYFLIRRKDYIFRFIPAALAVFFILPSLFIGFNYNNFLLKEWFRLTLKPFFFAKSYADYIDLRTSSQALPSAIGRLFVSGKTETFRYFISPFLIHIIIRVASVMITLFCLFAVYRAKSQEKRGLGYVLFLFLALLLPQYCIYYSWCWMFVAYYAVFNYISYPLVSGRVKKFLLLLVFLSYLPFFLIGIHRSNQLSTIFWSTLFLMLGMIIVSISRGNLSDNKEVIFSNNPASRLQRG